MLASTGSRPEDLTFSLKVACLTLRRRHAGIRASGKGAMIDSLFAASATRYPEARI